MRRTSVRASDAPVCVSLGGASIKYLSKGGRGLPLSGLCTRGGTGASPSRDRDMPRSCAGACRSNEMKIMWRQKIHIREKKNIYICMYVKKIYIREKKIYICIYVKKIDMWNIYIYICVSHRPPIFREYCERDGLERARFVSSSSFPFL